jgi:hypothetical protein
MQNSDRSYANRIRRLKGKIYASGTSYLSPTAKSAENMLVRIESQNPLRSLTPAGSVVEVSCCDGGAPVTTYSAIVYSANPTATSTDDKCIPFTTLEGSGASDAYVVRYNDNGQAQWAARIGGSLNDNGIVVSSFGADYCAVAGIFTSPVLSFYNADSTTVGGTLVNSGGRCIFLAVYDGTGVVQRMYRVSDIGPGILRVGMTTSTAGDIYLTGTFTTQAITFTNASGVNAATIAKSAAALTAGFLVKYQSIGGGIAWEVAFKTVDRAVLCEAVSIYGSSVYITGSYSADITFLNTGGGMPIMMSYQGGSAFENAFIVQYDDSGIPQWAARIGGTTAGKFDTGFALHAANDGIYVSGTYSTDVISIDNAVGGSFATLANIQNGNSFFITKYNLSGAVVWATRVTAPGTTIPMNPLSKISFMGISNSNIYIVGAVAAGTVTSYNASGGAIDTSTTTNLETGYLISYNTSGIFQFRRYMYGSEDINTAYGFGVAALSGGVYTCGNYMASPLKIENGNGPGYVELINDGIIDAHILKYDDTGNLAWRTRVGGDDVQDAVGIATCASGSGCFVVGNYGDGLA